LRPPDYSPTRLAIALGGEWFAFQTEFSPVLFIPRSGNDVPDPERYCMVYAQMFSDGAVRLRLMNSKELGKSGVGFIPVFPTGLSRESKGSLTEGIDEWSKGYSRATGVIALYDATFDLLIRERDGTNLAGIKETFVKNPLTELPFDYDPTTRKISEGNLPADWGIEPLTLPKL